MELNITPYLKGQRPGVTLPTPQFLSLLTEQGVRQLVSDHYDLLVASSIKELFPKNEIALEKAKENSADFFIQILGGPQYFNTNRGRPQMASRHLPFKITAEGRVVWLECYREVLLKQDLPKDVIESFWKYINVFSNWMVNT